MKNIIRDNPKIKPNTPFTVQQCRKCGEDYIPSRIHICKARNSFPSDTGGKKVVRPTKRVLDSDILLDTIEHYCDVNDMIDFGTVYLIVKHIRQHQFKSSKKHQ